LAILAIFPAADFSAIPLAEKVNKASVSEYVLKIKVGKKKCPFFFKYKGDYLASLIHLPTKLPI
jgi:hypothetical protein